LVVIKTKAFNRINNNILSQIEQKAPYQDDEIIGIHVLLQVDPNVIVDPLVDVDGGREKVYQQLLDQ